MFKNIIIRYLEHDTDGFREPPRAAHPSKDPPFGFPMAGGSYPSYLFTYLAFKGFLPGGEQTFQRGGGSPGT